MKTASQILLCLLFCSSTWCQQQFYLRGETTDEAGNPLQNVTIINLRTGYVYKSGSVGSFGISNTQKVDSFSFALDGYRKEVLQANADHFLAVKLKVQPSSRNAYRQNKLLSLTKGLARDEHKKWFAGDETYASIIENRFINADRFSNTAISLNVDRASYSNIRRFLGLNSLVPPDAVRVEEMLNYFNLNYTTPKQGEDFAIQTQVTSCPWNASSRLFYINMSARKLDLEKLPPSNLVFLIDVSGSMDMTNRLPLLKSAFRLLVNNLRAKDSVAIVVYGGVTGVMMHTTSGAEKDSILRTIDALEPGGSTPGESGVKLAYNLARHHFVPGGNNRVILATDGDFNVGLRTENELDDLITRHRESGIYLTCLGVGMGNYKDSKIQTLARKGNGNFAYLDNFAEAEKVLLKEFTQTLYSVADDVYMNVDFNPRFVKEYRLLGFDNKVGALNDTSSVVEGGEIGSGFSMTGIFEIIPSLKDTVILEKFANVKVRYHLPDDTLMKQFSYNSYYNYQPLEKLDKSYKFSAVVAMFGSLLKGSPFTKQVSWNEMLTHATAAVNQDDVLQKEFLLMVQQAKVLYTKSKKKRRGQDE